MFLLGFYSAELRLNIKPRRKIHILSAAGRTACEDLKEEIYGKQNAKALILSPPKKALWGYTYLPFICLCLTLLMLIMFSENIIIKSVLTVLSLIFAIWFLFRFFALFRSSLKILGEVIEVKYFSGMNFTRVIFKSEDVVGFEISQSVFQRFSGRCNVKFIIANAKSEKIKIKHINKNDAYKLKFPPLL